VDLFARLVPDLVVVPVIVSGVISPTALRNPLTFLRRRKEDREWLAATIQMMMPALRNVTTRIAFGRPVRTDDSADKSVSRATLGEGATPDRTGRCRAMLEMRRMWRGSSLAFLFVTVFVDMIGYGIVIPLLPFYVQQYAPGAVLIGLLGSLYAAMQFFGGPFLGGLSDRTGRRPVLLLCLFGTSLAYLVLGLADTLLLLVTAVTLAGGASGTLATAQAYIADSTEPADRARGLGLIGAAFGLGLIAGPVLGGLLSLFSLSAPAFAASALALINVAFGFLILPESLPIMRRTSTPILRLNPITQLGSMLGLVNIRALLLAVFLLNLSFAGLLTNFPLFSNVRFGWDATANAFFFAFVGTCAVLTQGVLLGMLQPRFGEERLLLGRPRADGSQPRLDSARPFGPLLYPVVGYWR
jgi:MFS family permease